MRAAIYYAAALAIAALDRIVKDFLTPEPGQVIRLIPGVIRMRYAENYGIALSMFAAQAERTGAVRWVLVALMSICSAALAVMIWRGSFKRVGQIGAAMVLGGALGNLFDRIFLGMVIDMFEFEFVRFAVFNVADVFVTTGVAVLFIGILMDSKRPERKLAEDTEASLSGERNESDDKADGGTG